MLAYFVFYLRLHFIIQREVKYEMNENKIRFFSMRKQFLMTRLNGIFFIYKQSNQLQPRDVCGTTHDTFIYRYAIMYECADAHIFQQ